jgi:energy-coupling factor transporter ATP-binding protein EcfA2
MEISTTIGTAEQGEPGQRTRPYVGLRYFEETDASLFYGRDEHTTELLGKLARNRFVAVLGSSGSGKSSLVRAGLLPELRSGMIPQAGPRWIVVEFKPGNAPLLELAEALRSSLDVADARTLLEEGPLGIANAVAAARLAGNTNVLVIADQFEEVFRFQREERDRGRETEAIQQCQALVRRLLDATTESDLAVYVLVVMRSDYLGECSRFPELPERMSQSVYLVPRLRRDQVQEVITAPVGNAIEPALLQELLGKAGNDPDQLPRLQHLLSRMWDLARGDRLTMAHYQTAGGWDGALGQHLDEVYLGFSEQSKNACARVFQRLSDVDERNRVARRRASLDELTQVCGVEAAAIVSAFRKEGFLKTGEPVDITHECVLRSWDRIKDWLREEIEARDFYREINVRRGRGALLTGSEILSAQAYYRSERYNPAWALRYGNSLEFHEVDAFISESSKAEQKSKRRERRLRQGLFGLGFAALLATTVAALSFWMNNRKLDKANAVLHANTVELDQALTALRQYVGTTEATRTSQQNVQSPQAAFTVPEIAQLYNFPTELNGRGQTIGLIELGGGYSDSDLKAFFSGLTLPVPSIVQVPVDGGKNQPDSPADQQVTGDIEVAGAVAPAAQIVIYFAPNTSQGFQDAIVRATHDTAHRPSIISIGWGGPEQSWTEQAIQAMNQALEYGSSQGITIVAAAGDNGVTDGLSGLRAVDFTASSPWVLACGGTHVVASDGRIVSETVWNDGPNGGATGGGVSIHFPVPDWQASMKIPLAANGKPGRAIPDIAANASPRAAYRVYVHGEQAVTGGTSPVAPLWAGLIALMNQGLGRNVGYFNPLLYRTLGPAGVFRSITEGDNSYGKVKGYSAAPGWNPCAGWGSPDGRKLLAALKAYFGSAN